MSGSGIARCGEGIAASMGDVSKGCRVRPEGDADLTHAEMSAVRQHQNALTHARGGDVDFQEARLIVELGAGDGRIAKELARAGCTVEALDNDPGMVAAFRQTMGKIGAGENILAPVCHQLDMRSFRLEKKFDGTP